MRKRTYLFTMLAATALLSSCSNDENVATSQADETTLSFTLGGDGIITRSVTTEEAAGYKTVIEANDQIGIYGTGTVNATSNVLATVNADGNGLTTSSPITISQSSTAIFTAYAPYVADAGETLTFSVKASQSTADNFNASNLLTAKSGSVTASSPSVSLTFEPRLALVRIEMAGEEGVNTTDVKVNAKPQVTWTAASDDVSEAEGTATDITMWHQNASVTDATSQIFAAFVPAQTITGGSQFLTMTVGDKQYRFKPKSDFSLAAGKINKFKVTIGAGGDITIESITIDVKDWEVNDLTTIDGDLEEVVREPIVLISEEEGKVTSTTTTTDVTGLSSTLAGWNKLLVTTDNNATDCSITYDETAEAFKLVDAGTGKWYQKLIVYRTANNTASLSKYKLTFQAKTANNKDILVRVMKGQVAGTFTTNAYFLTGTSYSGQSLQTNTDWTEKIVEIDFSKISTATDKVATSDDLQYGIMFCFGLKSPDGNNYTEVDDLYIKDVKCVEVTE